MIRHGAPLDETVNIQGMSCDSLCHEGRTDNVLALDILERCIPESCTLEFDAIRNAWKVTHEDLMAISTDIFRD